MAEELIRAACETANCKYPDMEAMANFKREVTPSVVIGLIDGLRHAKGMAAINDARANGAAETIQHLRDDIAELRAQLPSQVGEAVEVVAYRYTSSQRLGGKWHYQESFPKWDDRKVRELGQMDELMTVAQHQRIMAAATHPADQVAEGVAVSRKRLEHWADKLEDSESNGYGWEDALAAELRALLNGGRE